MISTNLAQNLDASIEEHVFSGVIYVRQNGQVVYERAAGYADRANRRENTIDTRFGIASGTKFFTALAIGKLIEAGKLDFATRAAECVPWDFPRYSKEITIQQLLTHTSGIPDYYDEEKIDDFDNFTVAIPWSELRGPKDYLPVFPDEDMKFAPGARFSYSNGGYILLGVVIEEISGMAYRDFVAQEVFAPAGMTRSGYFAMNKLPENTAFGYIEEEGGEWQTNIYNLPIIGASDGGAFTTVHDLARLWDAFWGYELLSQEMVELYTQPYSKAESEGPHEHYGHGIWIHDSDERGRETYITGCDAGVSMKSGIMHATDTLVTVLSNTTEGAWPVLADVYKAVKG
jgi:CubicO group peptidase (beta-lactamase class C family)